MKKRMALISTLLAFVILLSGCQVFDWFASNVKEEFIGIKMKISTYDESAQMIDEVQGESISIAPDERFAITDSNGDVVEKSAVLNITVGGKEMMHVGSTLIAHDIRLQNKFTDFAKTVNIENFDKSIPLMNRFANSLKNTFTGDEKIILIRSQAGYPLATFIGKKVSTFGTDIDKTTGLLVDDYKLIIYRADYTIYDADLLLEN